MSEKVRLAILKLLLDHDKTGSPDYKGKVDIGRALGLDEDEVYRQAKLLECEGLVDAAGSSGRNIALRIAPAGVLYLERVNSDLAESQGTTEPALDSKDEIAKQHLRYVVQELFGTDSDLVGCLRRYQLVAQIMEWQDDEGWTRRELQGYADEENLPDYRIITCRSQYGPRGVSAATVMLVDAPEELASQPQRCPIRWPVTDLLANRSGGYAWRTGKTREVESDLGPISADEKIVVPPRAVQFVLAGVTNRLFELASRKLVLLQFGSLLPSVFDDYRKRTDRALAQLGIDQSLKAIYDGLQGDNPESWKNAVLGCRSVFIALSDHLWQDPAKVYPYILNDEGEPISVARGKEKNRLKAYLHQEGASKKKAPVAHAELELLGGLVFALHGEMSKAKREITYEEACSLLLHLYLWLGELIRLTDMQPVLEVQRFS